MLETINLTTEIRPNLFTNPHKFYLWTLTLSDRRSKGWLLVDSIAPVIIITLLYLFIVWIGPKLMKNRKPLNVEFLMLPYNFSLAVLNGWICIQFIVLSWRLNYSFLCESCEESYHPDELKMVNTVWWFYFSKIIELMDTIFFIVRKKSRQLTFLHVYHHSTMIPLWWIGIKWVPSGSTFFPAMVNSFIHVVMYTYYALSIFQTLQKYLWWKKYLTVLQLCQFALALVMGINGIRNGCKFPLWMNYTLIAYMSSFLILFGKFYRQEYLTKQKKEYSYLNGSTLKKVN